MPHPDHEKNRATWNKQVDLHVYHEEYKTQEVIEGGSSLKQIELDALGDVRDKTLLHLMCQFGLDTLSWARRGAIVTGVDISERSVEVAREIAGKAGLPAEFVRSDVLDLIGVIDRLNQERLHAPVEAAAARGLGERRGGDDRHPGPAL